MVGNELLWRHLPAVQCKHRSWEVRRKTHKLQLLFLHVLTASDQLSLFLLAWKWISQPLLWDFLFAQWHSWSFNSSATWCCGYSLYFNRSECLRSAELPSQQCRVT
jgi:hypothetical protein